MADEIDVLREFRDETPGPSTDAWLRARSAIAAVQAEEGRSRPLTRRRAAWPRLPSMAAAAAGVAAVGVLAAVLVSSAPTGNQVETTAYLTRVEDALAAGQQDFIGYARTAYSEPAFAEPLPGGLLTVRSAAGGPSFGPRWAVGAAVRWSYRGTAKFTGLSPAGQRLFSWQVTAGNGAPVTVAVLYANSTWWRANGRIPATAQSARAASSCGRGVDLSADGWPTFIRNQLRCGAYTIAGRQWVDGVDAVKISGAGQVGLRTLWVDPRTYLPVRVISAGLQTDFQWLKPTPALLAELSLPVPHHYREVRPPS